MSEPRGVDERIGWMLDHPPGEPGWCAREVWQALGGDQSPPSPPAWGCADANACYDKVKAAGRYWTHEPIPRGAAIYWRYGSNGHAALSYGDGRIVTTDPNGHPGGVGVEDLDYPERWGASASARIWTDQYAGVRFAIDGIEHGDVYLSKLRYGQLDSDSVRRLQLHLNDHPLTGGQTLPITGNLLDETAEEVRLDRQQHGYPEQVGDEHVSWDQLGHLIPGGCGCTLIDDTTETPDPPETGEGADPLLIRQLGLLHWYSGKKASEWLLRPDGAWHLLDLPAQPDTGIDAQATDWHMLYLRVELTAASTAPRMLEAKWVRSDGDATAYQSLTMDPDVRRSYPFQNVHFESGSGLGGAWWVKVTGGSDPVTLTTRYAKTHVVWVDEVEVALAAVRGAGRLLGRLLARAVDHVT